MTTRPRALMRAGLAAFAAAGLVLTVPIPAAAHNKLIGSTPADGANLPRPPAAIVLEFDQPVVPGFGLVAVLDESDRHHEQGDPEVVGATVTQSVGELAPGAYQISYRVGSADGDPITGTLTFTVAAPTVAAAPAPAATPEPSPEATSPDPHEDTSRGDHSTETTAPVAATGGDTASSALLLAAGGVVAAAVLAAVLFLVMGGRQPKSHDEGEGAETGR